MSTIYKLRFDSRKIPDNLIESILQEWCNPQIIEDRSEIVKTGIWCTILVESALGRELVEETYGIHVDACLSCVIDKFDNHMQGIDNLMRNRDPPPPGGGQSSMALPVEQKWFTPFSGCRRNLSKGVNHVTIPKTITCHLALPVPYCLGSEIPIPNPLRNGRSGSRTLHSQLL